MRILILISTDHYVRQFITQGAFSEIDGPETGYLSSARAVMHGPTHAKLAALPNYLGTVDDPREAVRQGGRFLRLDYAGLRMTLQAALRFRSRTMRHKTRLLPWRRRWRAKLIAVPGIRHAYAAAVMRRTGLNPDLHRRMREFGPDLLVVPTGGTDTLLWDGLRSARALGVPSLVLIHNWDNLSSKGAFAVKPDYMAVWGEQSVEHAERIHLFPRERVFKLGAPQFEHYFHHWPGSTEPPFPFRYALFAGCYAPFDELTPLRRLEELIGQRGLDVKVVYRPHPHRALRKVPDFFDEREFEHVVLDPPVRENYLASFEEYKPDVPRGKPLLPPLDYYPALFEHALFTICPLSTMIVESAIFERRVIVVAYDDGIHPNSPAQVLGYDHFEGVDRIEGFDVARQLDELIELFAERVEDGANPERSLREQVGWWLYWDERPYSRRLASTVKEIARREGVE